jgi:hypothetical protein
MKQTPFDSRKTGCASDDGPHLEDLLDNAEEIFQNGAKTSSAEHEALQAQLYEPIGWLKTELDWLKKSCHLRLSANSRWSTRCSKLMVLVLPA